MSKRRPAALLLALALLPLGSVSCVVVAGWPPLPPTTYHGLVVDRRHRPVAGAEVILHRSNKSLHSPLNRWLEDTDEAMAKTYTDCDGRFVITTRSGYATLATANAPSGGVTDRGEAAGSMGDTNDPEQGALPKELLIKLR